MTTKNTDLERRIDTEIKRLNARLELARAKFAKQKTEAEIEVGSLLDTVESKRDEAQEQLERLKESGGEAWEEASRGASKAWQDLQVAYKEFERGLSNAVDAATQ